MADNLSISISADSTKLRADLAVAQAALKDFATELRKTAAESLKTGDTSAVKTAAANYEEAKSKVEGLNSSLRAATSAHASHQTALQSTSRVLGEVRGRATEFGRSITDMADKIFPHFKEVLAVSIAGGVVEFSRKLREANQDMTETRNIAATLGTNTGTVEGFSLMLSKIGLSANDAKTSLARMESTIGTTLGELEKAGIKAGGGVAVLTGNMKSATDESSLAQSNVYKLAQSMLSGAAVFRGGAVNVHDYGKAVQIATALAVQNTKETDKGKVALEAAGTALAKIPDHFRMMEAGRSLFGKGFAQMIPSLATWSKDFRASINEVEHGLGDSLAKAQEHDKAYTESLGKARFYFSSLRNIVVASVENAAVPILDRFTKAFKDNSKEIAVWADNFGVKLRDTASDLIAFHDGLKINDITPWAQALITFGQEAQRAFGIVRLAFQGMRVILDGVAAAINGVFGTQLSGESVGAALLILKVSGAFGVLASAINLAIASSKALLLVWRLMTATPIGLILTAVAITAFVVYENWSKIGPVFTSLWDLMKAFAGWVADGFTSAWSGAVTFIEDLFNGLWNWIKGVFDKVIQAAKDAASWVAKAFTAGGGGSSGQTATGLAGGGYVAGPGSATSDSIRAWLSNGEFVNKAASVAHYGVDVFRALNSMAIPKSALGFAAGGLVGSVAPASPVPRFATGGLVSAKASPTSTINLTIGAETFAGLTAPDAIAERLVTVADRQRMRSAGNKPAWFGGR